MNATPQDDPAVIGLAAILVDDAADVATIRAIAPGVAVMTFNDVLDDDEALDALEAADVVALVPGDAGPALKARAADATRKARTVTGHHKARAVVVGPWKAGTPFPTPQGIDTPGSFLAWAGSFPPLEPPSSSHQGNGKAPAATPAVDDDAPMDVPDWPAPPTDAAFRGPAGEIVRAIEPHTEADPLAMLAQLLIGFGNLIGRGPYFAVDGARHRANEFAVVVGQSSVGRKGTSAGRVRDVLSRIDPEWLSGCVLKGLASGEGLITPVRDPTYSKQAIKEGGRVVDYEDVMTDAGVNDKRLLVNESEFGGLLRVLEREGNKLSAIARQAWDGESLRSMTKSPQSATDPHISIIGHITADELEQCMSRVSLVNGFANRFLWFAVRRARILPFGGNPPDLTHHAAKLASAAAVARDRYEVKMDPAARQRWVDEYLRLTTPPPGALGEVLNRAAPHVIRLSLLYALVDGSGVIAHDHLDSALALWDASARCAAYIFGDRLADPDADKILTALRAAAPEGLTRTQISGDVFNGHCPAARIKAALESLIRSNLARQETETTTGRPAARYYARELSERSGISPPGNLAPPLNSLSSLLSPAPAPHTEAPAPGEWRVKL